MFARKGEPAFALLEVRRHHTSPGKHCSPIATAILPVLMQETAVAVAAQQEPVSQKR